MSDFDVPGTAQTATKKGLSKKAKKGLIILCSTVLIAFIACVFQFVQFGRSGRRFSPLQFLPVPGNVHFSVSGIKQPDRLFSSFNFDEYIAVLYVEGVIQERNEKYNQDWLLNVIDELAGDSKNRGILLYIDSPGGGVYQSDEVYLALEDYKTITENPVWAYMGPLAASGGYYIACAADTIFANRNTLTGSIGVISATSVDLTALMAKHGIKMTTITAGKNKNMFNINSPLTDEQRAIMQSIADEAYEQFTDIVAHSRDMNIAQVRRLADGRIYTAAQAKKNGLIDYVDTYENAVDTMLETLFEDEDVSVRHFRFERKKTVYDYLRETSQYALSFLKAQEAPAETRFLESVRNVSGLPAKLPLPAYYYHAP